MALNTISTIELHSFSQPVHPTLHWLGQHRLRVLHVRDRLIPWQLRHFYYHHEVQTCMGVRLSLGITIGHLFGLVLQTIANICRLPYVFPPDVFQAGAILIPGLSSIARRISLPCHRPAPATAAALAGRPPGAAGRSRTQPLPPRP